MSQTISEVLLDLVHLKYPPEMPDKQRPDDKQLAGFFDISPAGYSNYKSSKRSPKAPGGMARSWAKHLLEKPPQQLRTRLKEQGYEGELEESPLAQWMQDRLANAITVDDPATLERHQERLKVSYLDYGVFCGPDGKEGFFREVYENRFLSQLGRGRPVSTPRGGLNLEELLRRREADVGMCYFATTSRAEGVRFATSPLRVSLSAVTLTKYDQQSGRGKVAVEDLAEWLCKPNNNVAVKPIVVRREVGHLYCLHSLRLQEATDGGQRPTDMLVMDAMNIPALKRALLEHQDEDVVPLVILDEYTALRLVASLGHEGLLVMPVTTTYTTQHSRFRRELPLYFMAIASRRDDERISALMNDTLSFFLTTEVETTARSLADTYQKLFEEVSEAVKFIGRWSGGDDQPEIYRSRLPPEYRVIIARQYSLFTLSLNEGAQRTESAYASYWSRILTRARRIVDEELFSRHDQEGPLEVVRRILATQKSHRERLNDREALEEIRRYFDLHDTRFDLKELRGHSAAEIVAAAETSLLHKSADEDVELQDYDSGELLSDWDTVSKPETAGLLELLNQLTTMYARIPAGLIRETKEGKVIAGDIKWDFDDGFKRYSRIFYATIKPIGRPDTQAGDPAGMLFVMEKPGCHAGDGTRHAVAPASEQAQLEKRCELRYLMVPRHYRGHNVSRVLISHAMDWCSSQKDDMGNQKYTHVRIALLPALEEAIRRFRVLGFQPAKPTLYDREENKGHIVYERRLGEDR